MKIDFLVSEAGVRFSDLFGHCSLRVFFDSTRYVNVGRFSHSALDKFRFIDGLISTGCLADIGSFCEFAPCDILLGGEHQSVNGVNQIFSGCPPFQALLSKNGVGLGHLSAGPIRIGNGVIVSSNVVILSGSEVGHGTLIGASSLVKGRLVDFAVYAGNPARKLRDRDVNRDHLHKFWSSSCASIHSHLTESTELFLQNDIDRQLAITLSRDEKGRLSNIKILGTLQNEKLHRLEDQDGLYKYAKQLNAKPGESVAWKSDALYLH